MARPIDLNIVTGFLGAGKTTFINRLIHVGALTGTAFVVNEFGEIGLDHLLVQAPGESVVELSNGCLCCTVRSAFVDTLVDLATRPIRRVVVETTGLADPLPLLQAVHGHGELALLYGAPNVVTLTDATNLADTLKRFIEARRQLALADAVVIAKTDLLDAERRSNAVEQATALIGGLNPNAPVHAGQETSAELAAILKPSARRRDPSQSDAGLPHPETHRGSDGIASRVIRHDRPVAAIAVEMFCELVASAHGEEVLRVKGLVAVEGRAGPVLIQGAQGLFSPPLELERWPNDNRSTRLVVITQNMDPRFIEKLFRGFANSTQVDTPDRQALSDNPLAIAGFSARRSKI